MNEPVEPPARGSSLNAEPAALPEALHESNGSDASGYSDDDGGEAEQHEEQMEVAEHSSSSESELAEEAEPRHNETWQTFLRQVSPQDIARRDPRDPVRRAYVENRNREVAEESRQRRRAATAASYVGSGRYQSSSRALVPGGERDSATRRRPMSLQLQNRPLPPTPTFERERQALPGEYVVPKWQPDQEATRCPICRHEFNIFYRRHHCRKCGRVVCANCSPHRITIPMQFIVQPPAEGEQPATRRTRTDILDFAGGADGPSRVLGGGEEVRLCNPCVPDPNPLPPPSYFTPNGQHFAPYPRTDSLPAHHRGHLPSSSALIVPPEYRLGPGGHEPPHSGQQPPHVSRQYDRSQRWSGGPNLFGSWNQQRGAPSGVQSPYGSAPMPGRGNWPLSGLRFGPTSDPNAPLPPTPPPPPPPLREEDECPVCHTELPPKGTDGSEREREAHVVTCIQTHFSSSGPRSVPQQQQPAPEAAIAAAIVATSATPAEAGGGGAGVLAYSSSPRRRAPGMLVYHATEKDCVGDDEAGTQQECVICFEEFEVGVEMGRLECLCKFHRICIRQWWDTKGVGACPVHQNGI